MESHTTTTSDPADNHSPKNHASRQRVIQKFCLMLVFFLFAIRPFIWAIGILSHSSGLALNTEQIQTEIAEIDKTTTDLMTKASLSPAEMVDLPPERIDANFRDKNIVKQAEIAAYPKDQLLAQLRREQMRLKYVKQRPIAYGFIALGLALLALGGMLLRLMLKQIREIPA